MRDDDRNIPFEVRHIDRAVGVVLVFAVFIVLAAWLLRQQGMGELEEKFGFYTMLSRSYGLAAGGSVDLSGIRIGRIQSVRLQPDGRVRVDLELFGKHRAFLTEGSQLEVQSGLGLPAILGGGSLVFVHNAQSDVPLEADSLIPAVEPVELAAILDDLELPKLTGQVKNIVSNVEAISLKLQQDQGALFATLQNIEGITRDLAQSSQQLPLLVGKLEQRIPSILESVDASLGELRNSVGSVAGILAGSEQDIRAIIENAAAATGELTQAAQELKVLLKGVQSIAGAVDASADRIPKIMAASEELVENSAELTERLNNHWLLRGTGQPAAQKRWPTVHPASDSLYENRATQAQ